MSYKFKDHVGVFLISGGKNSVLALDMLHLEFINRIGILIDIDNYTLVDDEYIKYLQQKYNMTILRVNLYKCNMDKNLQEEIINKQNIMEFLNPIYLGLNEIRNILLNLQINRYKIILGANKTYPLKIKANNILLNPLSKMTEEDVLTECTKRDIKLIDTYEHGFTKHDSFPSFSWLINKNSNSLEQNIKLLKKHYPDRYNFWCEWEKKNNMPFFNIDKELKQWIHKV